MIDLDMPLVPDNTLQELFNTETSPAPRAILRAALMLRDVGTGWDDTVIMSVETDDELQANGETKWISEGQEVAFTPTSIIASTPLVGSGVIRKAVPDDRYTLGSWYIPDSVDAHGDWTDPTTLQKAAWDYMRKGERTIYLQHDRGIPAGELVELMSWPEAVTVQKDAGEQVDYPAGTVFVGVIWEEWAWPLVKTGKLTGMSIGGWARHEK